MSTESDNLPTQAQPSIRVMAMPADTNAAGDIFGGWLMSQADIAGSIEAMRHAQCRVVTVAVNEFQFIKPVYVGDLISIFTQLKRIGTTSLQIDVQAFAQSQHGVGDARKVAQAVLTYVALDEHRRPRPVLPES